MLSVHVAGLVASDRPTDRSVLCHPLVTIHAMYEHRDDMYVYAGTTIECVCMRCSHVKKT